MSPDKSSLSSYNLEFPDELPSSDSNIVVNSSGKLSFSPFDLAVNLDRQKKDGSDFCNVIVHNSTTISYSTFGLLYSFENYNQIFLNGMLQYGDIKTTDNLTSLVSSDLDYVYDQDNQVYFLEEDIDNEDIIVAYGNSLEKISLNTVIANVNLDRQKRSGTEFSSFIVHNSSTISYYLMIN